MDNGHNIIIYYLFSKMICYRNSKLFWMSAIRLQWSKDHQVRSQQKMLHPTLYYRKQTQSDKQTRQVDTRNAIFDYWIIYYLRNVLLSSHQLISCDHRPRLEINCFLSLNRLMAGCSFYWNKADNIGIVLQRHVFFL